MHTTAMLCAMLIAACAALVPIGAGAKEKDVIAVRAYINDACIVADEPYFLQVAAPAGGSDQPSAKLVPRPGLALGSADELIIKHEMPTADRRKAGVARQDMRYAAALQVNLYRADFDPAPALEINAALGCMTIVAANFKPGPANCSAAYQPKTLAKDSIGQPQSEWKTSRTDDSIENQLRRADICVNGKTHAVYEARFEFSNDGTAYRLKDAGYRIDALLTADKPGATRTVLYTVKISDPGAKETRESLSSAWVNLGMVTAGARSHGSGGDPAPWLRVPPLSIEARRSFDENTRAEQQVTGEIQALQRALARNQRELAGLDHTKANANADQRDGSREERARVTAQNQSQAAELEARRAEYQNLPRTPAEFMPVAVEVAVTEAESEKAAQIALADLVGNADLAAAAGNAAAGPISKSASPNDIKIAPDSADSTAALEHARAGYFDAVVALETGPSASARRDLERALAVEKDKYNEARLAVGLGKLK